MMKLKQLLFFTFATLFVFSCKEEELMTPSGYKYKIVEEGTGKEAKPGDYVFFSIVVRKENGDTLQEVGEGPNMPVILVPAKDEPSTSPNPVGEIMGISKVGHRIIMYMPIDSMPNAPEDLKDQKFIEYEMVVTKVLNQNEYMQYSMEQEAEFQKKMEDAVAKMPAIGDLVTNTVKDYKAKTLKTKQTASGLKYYVVEEGKGEKAKAGQSVSVHYYGVLTDNTLFDSSFKRGEPFNLELGKGQVIPGWDEGLALFNKGTKAFLFIPSNLGYGEAGSPPAIPGGAELVFYVEMLDIK